MTREGDAEELGDCPNNTKNTVCLSPSCKYKHDRIWLDPEEIKSGMTQWGGAFIEWTPEHELSFESYVDRMLKTPAKCPCGCGILLLPKKKETDDAQDNDEAKKETDNAQGNDEE